MLNRIMKEAKKFGVGEVIEHTLVKFFQSEEIKTKMYKVRDKYYSSLSQKEFEKEIEEIYFSVMNQNMDFNNVSLFTEKVQWLKIHGPITEMAKLSDKYIVKEWVAKAIGEEYVPKLLGVWDRFEEINFDELPESFCLKMNHGSGMNVVVKDKKNINVTEIKKKFDAWCEMPFEAVALEKHYKYIPRKIIAEEYMEELSGNLYDYKIHCFNGEPLFVQCIGKRNLKKHTGYQNNFDMNWNRLDWTFEDYPQFTYDVPKPDNLQEMIDIAKKLSEGFWYVRVDLYDLEGRVLFGEMTFTPSSGLYPYRGTWNYEMDRKLGALI